MKKFILGFLLGATVSGIACRAYFEYQLDYINSVIGDMIVAACSPEET